jgi:hypothetical protein
VVLNSTFTCSAWVELLQSTYKGLAWVSSCTRCKHAVFFWLCHLITPRCSAVPPPPLCCQIALHRLTPSAFQRAGAAWGLQQEHSSSSSSRRCVPEPEQWWPDSVVLQDGEWLLLLLLLCCLLFV